MILRENECESCGVTCKELFSCRNCGEEKKFWSPKESVIARDKIVTRLDFVLANKEIHE